MQTVWMCLLLTPGIVVLGWRQQEFEDTVGGSLLSTEPKTISANTLQKHKPGLNAQPTFLVSGKFPRRVRRSWVSECKNASETLSGRTHVEDNNYDGSYVDDIYCIWSFTALNSNDRILLVSTDFLLEDSYNCRYDYVEIFDGDDEESNSIGKLCGRKHVRLITRTRKLTIKFKTDSSVTAPGFRFEVTRLPASSEATCNKTYQGSSGTILSPEYGPNSYYPDNVTCLYSIKAPATKKVKLQFQDFALERSCKDDYLTVYDGKTSESSEIGTYCGRDNPKSITSSSSDMLLFFHTNTFIRNRGFKLAYTFVDSTGSRFEVVTGIKPPGYDPDCSSIITSEGRNVSSPHFRESEYYLQRRKCRTVLTSPQGHGVLLRFRKYDVEESLDCIFDHVNVTYSAKKGVKQKVRLCGYQPHNTPCFFSHGDITLDFTSDVLFEGSGYEADYSFVALNQTDDVTCDTQSCSEDCRGYCYNNGDGYHCACPVGKVPPDCVQNITWVKRLRANLTMYEGTTFEFSCAVNHPHSITVWDSNFFMLPNDTKKHIVVNRSGLKVHRARVTDSGLYTCTVQAGDKLMSQSITLTVKHEEEYCGIASDQILNPNRNSAYGTIAGKNSSKASDYIPWQVHLWDKSKESHHCGGVLISETHVLTAAHCVKGPKAADFNHNNIRVSVGTLSCRKADAEKRNVARYITHPSYNETTLEYDFALLELNRPIYNKSNRIYPICLPTAREIWSGIHEGYKGVIAGCGKHQHDIPDIVHMTSVPLVNRTTCRDKQRKGKRKFSDDMFCAGYKEKEVGDACDGDSGGGFVAKLKGRWTLLGLISFGNGCAREGRYGFYANVSHALSWIQDVAPSCGRTRFIKGNYESGKILKGQVALAKQFPWVGVLLHKRHVACSVTVISSKYVITSRHCVENGRQREKLTVALGTLNANRNGPIEGRVEFKVARMIIADNGPDVALLELGKGLHGYEGSGLQGFSDYIQPACLPGEGEEVADDEKGWVAGWGQTNLSETANSDKLLYAEMIKTSCDPKLDRSGLSQADICFASTVNASIKAFRGDSGAGVVGEKHGRYTLSAIYKSGHPRLSIGVYTGVPRVVKWMKEKMGWVEDVE